MNWLNSLIEKLLSVVPRLSMVNPDEAGARITLGKHVRPIGPGWYIYWPILQEMAVITVTPQVKDVRVQSVWTIDQIDLCIGLAVRYRVKDAVAAQFKVQDYDQSLQNSALVACIEYVSKTFRDNLIVHEVNKEMTNLVQSKARGWGIDVQDVSITDVGRTKNIRVLTDVPIIPIEGD